jgi:hypothetical protein
LKARVLIAAAALGLASAAAPPLVLDRLASGEPPLIDVQTWIQHVNILTS